MTATATPDRPLARMPRALADGDAYHALRMAALDTAVALSILASDSSRFPKVGGALKSARAAGGGARSVKWGPLRVTTSYHEVGRVVGHRRRIDSVRAELNVLAATADPAGDPLLTWEEAGERRIVVTISAWWHTATRGSGSDARIVPSAYATLPQIERRCYVWLAAWGGIDGADDDRRVGLDTLVRRLWLEPPLTSQAQRDHRARTRKALRLLNRLPDHGWHIMSDDQLVAVASDEARSRIVTAQPPPPPPPPVDDELARRRVERLMLEGREQRAARLRDEAAAAAEAAAVPAAVPYPEEVF